MQRITFSSSELPGGLDDEARFSLWRDVFTARYGLVDLTRSQDRPFSLQFAYTQFGRIGAGQFEGTINGSVRTSRAVAADPRDDFCLILNRSRSPISGLQRGKETVLAPGAATLYSYAETNAMRTAVEYDVCALVIPRSRLVELVAKAEDLLGAPLDPAHGAVRLLQRYLDIVLADGIGEGPALAEHVGTTLLDLTALALGATRDAVAIAEGRGLRAARLREVLAAIEAGFADPEFSPVDVARRLGVSPRYVRYLLHDTGSGFTARVLELRLQRARAMLADPRHDRLKIGDIASACGFNEVPYFNRCFHRRFGASPTKFRSRGG